jgi:hypothetical protein
LKENSTVSEVRFFQETKMRLRSCLKFISRPKNSFSKHATHKKRIRLKNSRQCAVRTPTTRLNRKSSSKKKCRFWRNAWRTWKLSTDWMKKNLISIQRYWPSAQLWTKRQKSYFGNASADFKTLSEKLNASIKRS